jgi:hypothetical protein
MWGGLMKRLVIAMAVAAPLLFATTSPAVAGPPVVFGPFVDSFKDVNPCTGDAHTVSISLTFYVHEHDDREVVRGVHTISTSDGFVGKGTETFVANGNVLVNRFTDMLSDGSGARFRAQNIFVLDLRTDTVRMGRFRLTCLGS